MSGNCNFREPKKLFLSGSNYGLQVMSSCKEAVNECKTNMLVTEVLNKQMRVKISDNNFERRFDDPFIIFKFIKTKSQIHVRIRMCLKS